VYTERNDLWRAIAKPPLTPQPGTVVDPIAT
jgi:hypothetical protein